MIFTEKNCFYTFNLPISFYHHIVISLYNNFSNIWIPEVFFYWSLTKCCDNNGFFDPMHKLQRRQKRNPLKSQIINNCPISL